LRVSGVNDPLDLHENVFQLRRSRHGDTDEHGQIFLAQNAKVHDRQNRLGFAVSLAAEVAESDSTSDSDRVRKLRECLRSLEASRLAGEDTFCHDAITNAERTWLRRHRSPVAAHWNLLTDLTTDQLAYAPE
jgi:hypothetical protein